MSGGASGQTVPWVDLLQETIGRLSSGGCPDPEVSGRRIMEEVTGADGAGLWAVLDRPATIRGVARLDELVARRLAGEPLQYVVGRWAFRSLDLMIDPRVLIPRPETEVVAGRALDELDRLARNSDSAPIAVDLGTGSGAIGLSLAAEHPTVEVWLTDRSSDAVAVARANLAGLGRHGSRVQIVEGSWFEALGPDLQGRIDVLVSNPPYVADDDDVDSSVEAWEPSEALFAGPDGTGDLVVIIDEASRWLTPAGALVLEMAPEQTGPMAERARRWFDDVEIFEDLTGRARGLVARVRSH